MIRVALLILASVVLSNSGKSQEPVAATLGAKLTIKGSMVCNGACIQDPKFKDHVMVVYAMDGTDQIREEVNKILADFYPERGLDGEAAQLLMNEFTERLKYYVSPNSLH